MSFNLNIFALTHSDVTLLPLVLCHGWLRTVNKKGGFLDQVFERTVTITTTTTINNNRKDLCVIFTCQSTFMIVFPTRFF